MKSNITVTTIPEEAPEYNQDAAQKSASPPASGDGWKSAWKKRIPLLSKDRNQALPEPKNILEAAWQLTVDYDYNAERSVRRHMRMREAVIILGVIATLLAILSDSSEGSVLKILNVNPAITWILRFLLILVPITSSVVLAMANRFQEGERWLALKTGAENVMRVIYLSRTILSPVKGLTEEEKHLVESRRDQWLEERLAEIRRETLHNLTGNLALRSFPWEKYWLFEGTNPRKPLGPEQYIGERLNFEIEEYSKKIVHVQTVRIRLVVTILTLGGIGSLIAALSNMEPFKLYSLSIWVAVFTAIAIAVSSWSELRELDWRVQRGVPPEDRERALNGNAEKAGSRGSVDDPLEVNVTIYGQIINELTIAREHWLSLGKEEAGTDEFYELVLLVERILWGKDFPLDGQIQACISQLNRNPVDGESGNAQSDSVPIAGAGAGPAAPLQTPASGIAKEAADTPGQEQQVPLKPRRVVVLMPSGRKLTPGGLRIDYDNIYNRLIEKALPEGFSIYRWTKNKAADSVQELLLAEIVIADIGFDDPDVFYNLALRHAYRSQGIIHIREINLKSSFRTFNVRTSDYHCNKYGRIDSAKERADRDALRDLIRNICDSPANDNPVFNLLPHTREPDLRSLQAPSAVDFWSEDEQRRERLANAQKLRRIGDILLLTEEIHNPQVKEDAYKEAGQALQELGRHDLALSWYRKGRELNPRDLCFRREEAISLNRIQRPKDAIVKLESLLEENPGDGEALAYLARIYKDIWYDTWCGFPKEEDRQKKAFESSHWLLKSFETYLKGYRLDLNKTNSGANAFTLGTAYVCLAGLQQPKVAPDAYLAELRQEKLPKLRGALTFALETRIKAGKGDYWTLVALAELCAMTSGSAQEVRHAYRQALMGTRRTRFRMQSALRQLQMLHELQLPGLCLEAGIRELLDELEPTPSERAVSPALESQERQVFLFIGDTGSASGTHPERWQDRYADQIQLQIEDLFAGQKLEKGDQVLVIATGMGSPTEILFVEYCVRQGYLVQVYMPLSKEKYVEHYVRHDCDDWEARFENLRSDNLVDDYYQDTSLVPIKETKKIFERNTSWAKYYAQIYGKEYRQINVEHPEDGCPRVRLMPIKSRNPGSEELQKSHGDPETPAVVHQALE